MIGVEGYVDGGGQSPTRPDVLADCALDAVIVSSPMSARPGPAMVGATGWSTRLLGRPYHHRRLAQEVLALRRRGVPVLVFEPTPADLRAMGRSAMDPGAMPAIAASAEASARALLAGSAPPPPASVACPAESASASARAAPERRFRRGRGRG